MHPQTIHGERRSQPRVGCAVVFPATSCDRNGVPGSPFEIAAIDLSAGGLRFRSDASFVPGDRAVLRMTSRAGAPGLVGVEIVHATTTGAGKAFGARFIPLTPDVVRALLTQPPDVRRHRASA